LRTGAPPEQMHWNGPYKPEPAIEKAVAGGSLLHIDNLDEVTRIERVAERLGLRPRVALRVNLSIEGLPAWSRFGLNLESGQARYAAQRILAGDRMEL